MLLHMARFYSFLWQGCLGFLMLSFMSSLCILDTNLLFDILLANTFSQSVSSLFIFFIMSFTMQNLLFDLSIFLLLFPLPEETYPKKYTKIIIKEETMFSARSFMISDLTCKSVIRFEYILVHGMKEKSGLTPLHIAVEFSQHHLLNKLSFSHFIFLPPLS